MKWLSDMVKSDGNGKVSGKKTTFLLTWLVASGIVIGMAVNNTLGFEVFTAYLVYGVGADAFGKYMAARTGSGSASSEPNRDRVEG